MTPDEWFSKPDFANELRKVLNAPVFRLALEVIRDFKAPDTLLLAKPDLLVSEKAPFYLGQIHGFKLFMGALYDLTGTQMVNREPTVQYADPSPDDSIPTKPIKRKKP